MSRIGASIAGLERFLLNNIARSDQAALASAVRLATGNKINRASDDPAAFAQLSAFEHRQSVVQDTRSNVDAAATIGAQSQLNLGEVRAQIVLIRNSLLLDENQTLTSEDRLANQLLIDAAITELDSVAKSEISGKRYLDGSVDYRYTGKSAQQISDIEVFALGETAFSGSVDSAATQSVTRYTGTAGNVDGADTSTLTLTGKRGSASLSTTGGELLTDVADRINLESHRTGITASVSGNDLDFTTVDFGDNATINVAITSGTFATASIAQGADATATINGEAIDASQIDGNTLTYAKNGTHVRIEFATGFSGNFNSFSISDQDVSKFALSPELNDLTSLAFSRVSADSLGGLSGKLSDLGSGGSLSGLGTNTSQALRVVDEALAQLTLTDAQADSFADTTVASAASLLSGYETNLAASIDSINGVNQDEESLLLAKNQALSLNSISAISLLQQQQASVLGLLRLLSGI
ncbi:MAG: hypothetical protein QGG71_04970 [Pirellulaceae bacterium]|nr:hypothetical protein [Pirellulaceae bacterium]